jgi:hypothetical protein
VFFTKRKKAERFIEPLVLDSVKYLTSSVKCLGFLLDAQLTQWKHVKERVRKLNLPSGYVIGPSTRPKASN